MSSLLPVKLLSRFPRSVYWALLVAVTLITVSVLAVACGCSGSPSTVSSTASEDGTTVTNLLGADGPDMGAASAADASAVPADESIPMDASGDASGTSLPTDESTATETSADTETTATTVRFVSAPPSSVILSPIPTPTTLGEPPVLAWVRYQENDPHIIYSADAEGTSDWSLDTRLTVASDGKVMYAQWWGAADKATICFQGTGIALMVVKNHDCCKAKLSLDGGTAFLVDTYSAALTSAVVWTSPDLAHGTHVLTVESTNFRNAASADYYLLLDAVMVKGSLVY